MAGSAIGTADINKIRSSGRIDKKVSPCSREMVIVIARKMITIENNIFTTLDTTSSMCI